ncbi:MAG TPA: hypothetical protein VGQ62_22680 [Chloroflexota bacterium]|nr:hypothetical protein [Chloroflexota bacterium]
MAHTDTTWALPFSEHAELELQTEWGSLTLLPVESGEQPRLELTPRSAEHLVVHVEKHGDTVRVSLDPEHSFTWFGGSECRATLYVPTDIRAHVQTNAGSVSVHNLDRCELGVKANAGKIELVNVIGVIHLAADAGSVIGRGVGGFFDIETHAGSIKLDIVDLQPGAHHIRASMGSVRLELVRGMDVDIETHTSLGSVRNAYPSRPGAPARLVLHTELGSVRIDEGRASRSTAPVPHGPAAGSMRPEDPQLDRILKMVEAGELSAHDADDLLRAMGRV